ncbi:MAG TPA: serine protease [Candidatus Binatia bacterium]|nr:serine protease [Candidatus Binatia bacterium]
MLGGGKSVSVLFGVGIVSAILGGAAGALYASRPIAPIPAPPPPPGPMLSPSDIALRSFASVVMVTIDDARGRPLGSGSGFVVEKDVVVTNFHVLKGGSGGSVRLVGDRESCKIAGVLASDAAVDLALLSVPHLEAAPLALGDSAGTVIGDKIFVVSNPQDLEGTFSEGIVSGKRKLENVRLLQITAPISSGSSGGPVLDGRARVVGVATSSLRSGQNLNFAITGDYIADLLRARGDVQELAKVTRPAAERPIQTARAGGFLQHLGRWFHWPLTR